MMRRSIFGFSSLVISLAAAACGSDGSTASTGSGGGTTSTSATGATTSTTGTGSGGGTSTGAGGGGPSVAYKTYVTLGDSISDKGGQPPFFYDVLFSNDDATYPEWMGKDLKTKYGLKFVPGAKAGAVSGDLLGQVMKLPAALEGPVAVTITIGGNDMQAHILDILNNNDQKDRDAFRANLAAALDELTKPDRFGKGVEVHVFEADIYDPTDGKGDFSKEGCPAPLSFVPVTPTDGFFMNWNAVASDEVPKHGMSAIEPLHMTFVGHGLNNKADGWFFADCIHPNKKGHNAIRSMFWTAITGEAAPGTK
jgi:lysophospholipase L1-like esterase